jgi:hypothetical protein
LCFIGRVRWADGLGILPGCDGSGDVTGGLHGTGASLLVDDAIR